MKKRCIRKHWARVDPIALAIAGATIASTQDLDKLRMRELSAIEAFAKGSATPHDFRDLCDMLNLSQTMGEMGIGPEVLPVCHLVELALLMLKDEHEARGCMSVWPSEIRAMRDLYEFHDLQRTSVDRSTYERCIQKTRNKIRGASPEVKVLV